MDCSTTALVTFAKQAPAPGVQERRRFLQTFALGNGSLGDKTVQSL